MRHVALLGWSLCCLALMQSRPIISAVRAVVVERIERQTTSLGMTLALAIGGYVGARLGLARAAQRLEIKEEDRDFLAEERAGFINAISLIVAYHYID